MTSSPRKDVEVTDFKEDDEFIESAAGSFLGKVENPKAENSPLTEFSRGTHDQGMEISDVSCVDVDASDSDRKCNNRVSYVLGTSEGDCAVKEGISGLNEILVSNSTSYEKNAHINPDNIEPGNLFPGCLRVNSLAMGALILGVPSAGNKQINYALPELPSNNEPVDAISDGFESVKASSLSTSSDIGENQGSLEDPASDHYSSGWGTENINVAVDVTPDYLIYGDRYCTESLLTFSCNCIKLEGSNACGSKESFSFEWAIVEVSGIESQWFEMVETALVKLYVRSTAEIGAENPHETSGIVELKFAVCDPCWSEKQERITLFDARYKALWKVVPNINAREEDDIIGKNRMFPSKRYFSNLDEPFEDVVYPKGDPDAVSISKSDVELLQPETFINDTVIDFYIKYLKNKIQPEDGRRFHFFNSFFFRKLADMDKDPSSAFEGRAAFQRVRKWTRKVNLFEKDYIFIPVNFNLHWSLIVICHPGEVTNFKDEEINKSPKVPCILHMDSIKGNHKGLKNLFQSYLWEEWKERNSESSEDVSSKFFNLRFVPLELPQQENSFDCGLFLLHYVDLFLEEAPVYFSPFKITKFSNFLNMDWFPPAEASLKRALIQKLIYELVEDHSQNLPPAACNGEHNSFGFTENDDGKESGAEFFSEKHSPGKTCHGNSTYSTADQGIEIQLLATSPAGAQCVRDPGLVFKELFEPGYSAGSFPRQYQPFDQIATFHKFKGVMSPVEEDAETGEHFTISPSGRAGFQPLVGITAEACTTSYLSRDFGISDTSGILMRQEEHGDADSSFETSSFESQNSSEVGVDEHPPIMDFACRNPQEETEMPRSVSPENVGCVTGSPASASNGRLETCIVEDSQKVDGMAESEESKDSLSSCQENPPSSSHQEAKENPPSLSHQEAKPAANENHLGDNVQLSSDDPASESDEQQAAKRPRRLETCIVEHSQKVKRMAESEESKDSLSSCQENPPSSSHQEAKPAANENHLGDNVQLSGDDPASESDEQQAAKRPRLMPPLEGERPLTRSATNHSS